MQQPAMCSSPWYSGALHDVNVLGDAVHIMSPCISYHCKLQARSMASRQAARRAGIGKLTARDTIDTVQGYLNTLALCLESECWYGLVTR